MNSKNKRGSKTEPYDTSVGEVVWEEDDVLISTSDEYFDRYHCSESEKSCIPSPDRPKM